MDDKSETADGEIDSRSNNRTGEFGREGIGCTLGRRWQEG